MKRILSMLLVLATVLCLLAAFPAAASAADAEEEGTESTLTDTYVGLYVKKGLVALFDAYGATASNTNLSSWTPVALYGNADYPDYVDPAAYTAKFTAASNLYYKWGNGCLTSYTTKTVTSNNPGENFTLTSLFNKLGEGATWSIQEVYQVNNPARTAGVANIIVDGDGDFVVTNYDSLESGRANTQAGVYGIVTAKNQTYSKRPSAIYSQYILNHFIVQMGYKDEDGTSQVVNTLFNNAHYLKNPGYVTYYKYVTATAEDGTETTTKTEIGKAFGGTYPAAVMEQTVSRTPNEEYTTDSLVAMDYTVTWQFAPSKIGPSTPAGVRSYSFVATAAQVVSAPTNADMQGGRYTGTLGVRQDSPRLSAKRVSPNSLFAAKGAQEKGLTDSSISNDSITVFPVIITSSKLSVLMPAMCASSHTIPSIARLIAVASSLDLPSSAASIRDITSAPHSC